MLVGHSIARAEMSALANSHPSRVLSYLTRIDALTEKQAASFAKLVPGSRVVRVPGSHHLFLSNAPEVAREVRASSTACAS